MYNIKLSPTIPRPVPAESDRIVAAHYYGAWKKGAAGLHEGFNDLAEEYNGGGHACASGATVYSRDEMNALIADADKRVKEYKEKHDGWL